MRLTASRRRFLRAVGLGTAAIALPFHRGILHAQAATKAPQRFVGLKYCNGIQGALWYPTGTGNDFALTATGLPRFLQPFKNVLPKVNVFRNLSLAASGGPVDSHDKGMFTFLTGVEMAKGGDVSIDQHLAGIHGKATPFPSIALGTMAWGSRSHGAISFRGPAQYVEPQSNPYAAFDSLFAGVGDTTDAAEIEQLRLEKKSVLDHVAEDLTALSESVGADDRRRLEFHLSSIREIEQSLQAPLSECTAPAIPGGVDWGKQENVPKVSKAMMDIIATAFACRRTSFATHTWGAGAPGRADQLKFPWIPSCGSLGMHILSHFNQDPAVRKTAHQDALEWHFQQVAYLLERMDEFLDDDGKSVLYHAAVLLGTDNGQSVGHEITHIPFLLAGNAGGVFRTGRCITYPDPTPHNKLLVAIANAFGSPIKSFGTPAFNSGPLSSLT